MEKKELTARARDVDTDQLQFTEIDGSSVMTGKSSSAKSGKMTPVCRDFKSCQKSETASKFSSVDNEVEKYLASETSRFVPDLTSLKGRLGVDLSGLLKSYHGETLSRRNQLSDKFDELEQDYLTLHQVYQGLLASESDTNPTWYVNYKQGTDLPQLSEK